MKVKEKVLEIYREKSKIIVEVKDDFRGDFTELSEVFTFLDAIHKVESLDSYTLEVDKEFWAEVIVKAGQLNG